MVKWENEGENVTACFSHFNFLYGNKQNSQMDHLKHGRGLPYDSFKELVTFTMSGHLPHKSLAHQICYQKTDV